MAIKRKITYKTMNFGTPKSDLKTETGRVTRARARLMDGTPSTSPMLQLFMGSIG